MADRTCCEPGCKAGPRSRGRCPKHYQQWLDSTPKDQRPPIPRAAFWDLVTKTHEFGCWPWTGPTNEGGYGLWGAKLAHRTSWAMANGPVPAGRYICHICDNPPCVNPRHLYPGTASDNALDMYMRGSGSNGQSKKTHCPEGHPYAGENLLIINGWRRCRTCERARKRDVERRRRARLRLLRPPAPDPSEWVSTDEAASRHRIPAATLRRWGQSGKLGEQVRFGRSNYYRIKAIDLAIPDHRPHRRAS